MKYVYFCGKINMRDIPSEFQEKNSKQVLIEDSYVGCESCVKLCPEAFELDGEVAVLKRGADLSLDGKIIEAAEACPVDVIRYELQLPGGSPSDMNIVCCIKPAPLTSMFLPGSAVCFLGCRFKLWDVLTNGYWHARGPVCLNRMMIRLLKWFRMLADSIFIVSGVVPLLIAVTRTYGLMRKHNESVYYQVKAR